MMLRKLRYVPTTNQFSYLNTAYFPFFVNLIVKYILTVGINYDMNINSRLFIEITD